MALCDNVARVVAGGVAALVVASALATLFSVINAANVASPGKSCLRTCEAGSVKTCSFTFNIHRYQTLSRACKECPHNSSHCGLSHCVSGDGIKRLVTVADHQLPGPAIHVCEGDTVEVRVRNKLASSGVSLHWHGLSPSPYMDGAAGVTQPFIAPNQEFRYTFLADRPGTHYWHALSGFQSGDGVFGPLVVRRTRAAEPHSDLYDHDLPQHVIMVHDWLHVPTEEKFTLHHHSGFDSFPDSLLVNGRGKYERTGHTPDSLAAPYAHFVVKEGLRYRLRVVNAGWGNCPVQFSVARHVLTVIASDGAPLVPYNASSIVLHPGERWDVVLRANQDANAHYWMLFTGLRDCRPNSVQQRAVLRYIARDSPTRGHHDDAAAHFRSAAHKPRDQLVGGAPGKVVNPVSGVCSPTEVCLGGLRARDPLPAALATPATILHLVFSLRNINNPSFYHDQHYAIQDEDPSSRVPTPQINNITFVGPSSPPLLHPTTAGTDDVCSVDALPPNCRHRRSCRCMHMHALPLGGVVELVLVDAGGDNDNGQTVHLHGHSFWVVGQGLLPTQDSPQEGADPSTMASHGHGFLPNSRQATSGGHDGVQRTQVVAWDEQGKLPRNIDRPLQKDTVMVPRSGYTIVRFKADNPGYWLLHSTVLFHWAAGMSLILRVGDPSDLPSPPANFPHCSL